MKFFVTRYCAELVVLLLEAYGKILRLPVGFTLNFLKFTLVTLFLLNESV